MSSQIFSKNQLLSSLLFLPTSFVTCCFIYFLKSVISLSPFSCFIISSLSFLEIGLMFLLSSTIPWYCCEEFPSVQLRFPLSYFFPLMAACNCHAIPFHFPPAWADLHIPSFCFIVPWLLDIPLWKPKFHFLLKVKVKGLDILCFIHFSLT